MLFVPCVDGISHSPREKASPGDIAAATSLVAATIAQADRLLG
jgi:acetylornithine deacetylase/succinyl-diaminopimelate desuccinylase-like protein